MNTAEVKQWIADHIGQNKILLGELEYHGTEDFSPRCWVRESKRKIKPADLEAWEYLLEPCPYGGPKPGVERLEDLVGCTVREFLHRDVDCFVVVVTDKADQSVILRYFNID